MSEEDPAHSQLCSRDEENQATNSLGGDNTKLSPGVLLCFLVLLQYIKNKKRQLSTTD